MESLVWEEKLVRNKAYIPVTGPQCRKVSEQCMLYYTHSQECVTNYGVEASMVMPEAVTLPSLRARLVRSQDTPPSYSVCSLMIKHVVWDHELKV